jgi:hypothetical protein
MNSSPHVSERPASKGSGCAAPLLAVVLTIGFLVLGGTFYVIRLASDKIIAQISQPAPGSLPALGLSPERVQDAQGRVREFGQAMEKDQHGATMVLRGQELQGVLAALPEEDWKPFKDRIFISMEEDHIRCDVSFPVPRILLKEYPGKYINGHVVAKIRNTPDGQVQVFVESAKLGDLDVPRDVLKGNAFTLMDLGGDGKKGAEALQRFVQKVSKVEIVGGTLQATLR